MRNPRLILSACTLAVICAAVVAAGAPGATAQSTQRFAMQPIEGGVLRLDTETGSMALCTKQSVGLVCEAVDPPGPAARDSERLATENRELKAEIKRLEALLAMETPQKPTSRAPRLELPSEEDVDKALSYMERMVKKFSDKLKDLEGGRGRGSEL